MCAEQPNSHQNRHPVRLLCSKDIFIERQKDSCSSCPSLSSLSSACASLAVPSPLSLSPSRTPTHDPISLAHSHVLSLSASSPCLTLAHTPPQRRGQLRARLRRSLRRAEGEQTPHHHVSGLRALNSRKQRHRHAQVAVHLLSPPLSSSLLLLSLSLSLSIYLSISLCRPSLSSSSSSPPFHVSGHRLLRLSHTSSPSEAILGFSHGLQQLDISYSGLNDKLLTVLPSVGVECERERVTELIERETETDTHKERERERETMRESETKPTERERERERALPSVICSSSSRSQVLFQNFERSYGVSLTLEILNVAGNKFGEASSNAMSSWLVNMKEHSQVRSSKSG